MVEYVVWIRATVADQSTGHTVLQRLNSELLMADREDVEVRFRVEEEDNGLQNTSNDARIMVSFTHSDPGNPVNWSSVRLRYPHPIRLSDVLQGEEDLHIDRRDCGSDQQYVRLVIAKWCDYLPRALLQYNEPTTTRTPHLSVSGRICPWAFVFRSFK